VLKKLRDEKKPEQISEWEQTPNTNKKIYKNNINKVAINYEDIQT